jgi:GNAT superfamily N-acetyltransferase
MRTARPNDLAQIRAIEVAAGELFRAIGMAAIADDPPPSEDELAACLSEGRAWVATDPADIPVAYILVRVVDGWAHIEQVSVHPLQGRKGLGSALIGLVDRWAEETGLRGLTLTTFRDVRWNAPYYERLGFKTVPEHELSAGLQEIVRREHQHGLDAWPRVVMRRQLKHDTNER